MKDIVVDCTLRDGGYYNKWDFPSEVVTRYLDAMAAAQVDYVELGLRSLKMDGFAGPSAYTTDSYLTSLKVPGELNIGVMINASEIVQPGTHIDSVLQKLFPSPAGISRVRLVRIASHVHEFQHALPACTWLKQQGFLVGFNLMQVADRSQTEIEDLALQASRWPIDVLYFADSMGSMTPDQTAQIVSWLRTHWHGPLGIHTHDNMGLALQNTLRALDEGVSWLDSTVTGMGRGPGNAKTEQLVLELSARRGIQCNIVPLMGVIRDYFQPLQQRCGWGTNPYYYLAGRYGIHPTYIQEMMSDSRYSDEDIVAVIDHLRIKGGKRFSLDALDSARHFYRGQPTGTWKPESYLLGSSVMLLGTGPGVGKHRYALEEYIKLHKPVVVALNTQSAIDSSLIDLRIACHPVRLLADCSTHVNLPQPLITPFTMLPEDVKASLFGKDILDFGVNVESDTYSFESTWCTTPSSLVIAYALAVLASGKASQVLMAGFDGYPGEDRRNQDTNALLKMYQETEGAAPLLCVTPSRYDIPSTSIYGLIQCQTE